MKHHNFAVLVSTAWNYCRFMPRTFFANRLVLLKLLPKPLKLLAEFFDFSLESLYVCL